MLPIRLTLSGPTGGADLALEYTAITSYNISGVSCRMRDRMGQLCTILEHLVLEKLDGVS
ncbi:hypothetical protein BDZ91DRAFT_736122 [Kalaharituber pfeilii]|nr:hypothetical protein BDZ91DRAFT_736122 [Kalaharituber pfeilii]